MNSAGFTRLRTALIVIAVALAGFAAWFVNRSTGETTAAESAVSGKMCTKPIWSSSARQGKWTARSGLYVNNNMWNNKAGPQTIYVCSAGSFYAVSNQSDTTSVKTYPSVARNFADPTISSFRSITSDFGEFIPNAGNWDAAYDIWTNGWNHEIMIWNQERNQESSWPPSGSRPANIDGHGFHVWRDSSDYVGLYMDKMTASGSVNILAIFKWLQAHGYMGARDTLTCIGYGVEISETPSREKFEITNFSLTTKK
jgi:hypothetical protein